MFGSILQTDTYTCYTLEEWARNSLLNAHSDKTSRLQNSAILDADERRWKTQFNWKETRSDIHTHQLSSPSKSLDTQHAIY